MSTVMTREQLVLPETRDLEKKIAFLQLKGSPSPLTLGNNLDAYEKYEVTPAIGTEFAKGVQLAEILNAPNSDAILRDLAILSELLRCFSWPHAKGTVNFIFVAYEL